LNTTKEAMAAESGVEQAGIDAGTTCAQGVKFRAFQKGKEKAKSTPFAYGGYNSNYGGNLVLETLNRRRK
jgi:hypothetical protein